MGGWFDAPGGSTWNFSYTGDMGSLAERVSAPGENVEPEMILSVNYGASYAEDGAVKILFKTEVFNTVGQVWFTTMEYDEYRKLYPPGDHLVQLPGFKLIISNMPINWALGSKVMKWYKELDSKEYFGAKHLKTQAQFDVKERTYQVGQYVSTINSNGPKTLTLLEHLTDAGTMVIGEIRANHLEPSRTEYESFIRFEESQGIVLAKDTYHTAVEGIGFAFLIGRYEFYLAQEEAELDRFYKKLNDPDEVDPSASSWLEEEK